ncbi:MAG: DNA gyrase subunit B [Mycoplasmataceae bacterium]|nr:DNA gyrase subunit B [Mycoplasmataceae bacterium]
MRDKYDASSIEVIESLEAVRKRPGMYIGDTGTRGLHHLLKEIIDNSIDEHLAGFATVISVELISGNVISVEDNGRGIPVDIHSKTNRPAVETIFTTLHAGGKFGGVNSSYKISGGLHGVGSSVVNALSSSVKVIVWKNKFEYHIDFSHGGKKITPLKKIGPTLKTGTKVTFKTDKEIFKSVTFNSQTIKDLLKELSYLNPGLKLFFNDVKNEEKYEFFQPQGLRAFVDDLTKEQTKISKTYAFTAESSEMQIKIAFIWTTTNQENIHSFVNNIITPDGGSHEKSFKFGLTKAMNEYAVENKLQQNGKALEGADTREGLFAVISLYLMEKYLQFEGQTKSKLSSNEAKAFGDKIIYEQIKHYLNKNPQDAKKIIEKAYSSKRAKEAARRAREVSRELSSAKNKSFAGKLVTAQSRKAEERELFIVEGDSAGGSAKLGRDRKTQAILPLKGKIVNTERATLKTILGNDELSMAIHAIGGGLGEDFNIKKANYGKVIIMTDADTDGAHIQALLLTFFYRFMKPLVDAGMVYIALPPLFKVKNTKTKKSVYAWSISELDHIKEKQSSYEIQRYKGLGEMNYQQLWETTMNPNTRTLIQVSGTNDESANKIIITLMGQDAAVRREWIEENVEFSLDDNVQDNLIGEEHV